MGDAPEVKVPEDAEGRISAWSQGDCFLGAFPMVWGFRAIDPLTDQARELTTAGEEDDSQPYSFAHEECEGVAVITQTCDIVRACADRAFFQVIPLVRLEDPDAIEDVKKRASPRLAYIPGVAELGLVGDLDRVFTLEKSMLAIWPRRIGCRDDEERRSLTETLRRFYSRPALPDDFNDGVKGLTEWIKGKHDKTPPPAKPGKKVVFHPGQCLKALAMVLVRAVPSWESPRFHVDFTLVPQSDNDGIPELTWLEFQKACESRVNLPKRMTSKWHRTPLPQLPTKTYLESELLDLNHLSDGTRRRGSGGQR